MVPSSFASVKPAMRASPERVRVSVWPRFQPQSGWPQSPGQIHSGILAAGPAGNSLQHAALCCPPLSVGGKHTPPLGLEGFFLPLPPAPRSNRFFCKNGINVKYLGFAEHTVSVTGRGVCGGWGLGVGGFSATAMKGPQTNCEPMSARAPMKCHLWTRPLDGR